MPAPVSAAAARAVGAGASATGERRRIVARNLQRILGRPLGRVEERRLVSATFESYARYYVESFRLPGLSVEEIDRGFSYEGFGEIEAACARGQGPILAFPHLGGWEWAAFWITLVGKLGLTAVVEPLEPPELFEWFAGFRESLGMNIVALGPEAGRESMQALARGDVLCLVADRDIQGNGIVVDFFGERTTLPAGPAVLALRTGSPLIPVGISWRAGTRHGEARPPIDTQRRGRLRDDIARVTQVLAHEFESLISVAPEQWHMLQPNWPSDYEALGLPLPAHLATLAEVVD